MDFQHSRRPPKKFIYNHSQILKATFTKPNLPDELIVEILSRLPVKSLLQFKIISKQWYKLISSSKFIKTHLSLSLNNSNITHQHLILSFCHPTYTLRHCSQSSLIYNNTLLCANDIDYPMKDPNRFVQLVGSLNGLVCINIDHNLFLWNPSLRKSNKLPSLGVKGIFFIIYGFGYNLCNDDYKVVSILYNLNSHGFERTGVKVYSRNLNCWRSIEGFENCVPVKDLGKFVSGKLHWETRPYIGSTHKISIVSLDLGNDSYGEVEQPVYVEGKFDLVLGILGGCLCVLCDYNKRYMDIWIMKEYGVKTSWNKFATYSYVNDMVKDLYEAPFCFLINGEILFVFGSMFFIYNLKDHSKKFIEINGIDACLEAEVYVESLISPSADPEQIE